MKSFSFALKQLIPILASYIFVGIAFGILMHKAGYSALFSCLSGFFIYAESIQDIFSMVLDGSTLIGQAVPFDMEGI